LDGFIIDGLELHAAHAAVPAPPAAPFPERLRVLEERLADVEAERNRLEHHLEDLRHAHARLEQVAHRFEGLFQGLPVACFCYDESGTILEWNRAFEALYGLSADRLFCRKIWETISRPVDREIVRALVASIFSGGVYEGFEWENVRADGAVRQVLSNVFPLRTPKGAIVGGICASVDVTERKAVEAALWESEERWQLALRGNNDGIWDLDVVTGRVFFSMRWKAMLGRGEDDPIGTWTEWTEKVHPEDHERTSQALQDHFEKRTEYYVVEHRLRCGDGTFRWILDRGQALWDRNGRPVRITGSSTDITERKRQEQQIAEQRQALEAANARLEALATLDGLTGLKNHRAFQERFDGEWERAVRHGTPLSLLLLDVDHFKQYNDTFGHPAGDEVLRGIARVLCDGVRETDFVGRYGGEEFAAILPDTDAAGALRMAERLRAAVEAAPWPRRPVTASIGSATRTTAMTGRADLLLAADQALYAAKHAGRNQVAQLASPPEDASPA
jgi:diguanylate cyclase (GGDEF)-like protein/PAS domain S-box-containing protein